MMEEDGMIPPELAEAYIQAVQQRHEAPSDDMWADHSHYVSEQRKELEEWLGTAVGATGSALFIVRHLGSDQVYDTEYSEGEGDILRLLEAAHAALVGARALALDLHAPPAASQ